MPRTGKTTLVKRIVEEFKPYFVGFWTEEIRENKRRVGFKMVRTDGWEKVLASTNFRTSYRVGKYFVNIDVIEEASKWLLQKINSGKIIVIDEVGKMEWYSEGFRRLFYFVLEEDVNLLAVVHRNFLHMVNNYYWLDYGKWWDVYHRVRREVRNIINRIEQ